MKFWRPGITGKLFLAIFATCIVLLISMHWAVRISFERGFIDYIKHGNEQRLQMLSDALSEQYAQHGNWRFLRNNDRFVFQILRSFEHDNDDDKPGPACRHTAGVHSFGLSIKMPTYWSARGLLSPATVCAIPSASTVAKWVL